VQFISPTPTQREKKTNHGNSNISVELQEHGQTVDIDSRESFLLALVSDAAEERTAEITRAF
jgi:hypothetical protein